MKPWTTGEIRYLEEHAGDGAEAVAEALGRTVKSVQVQAQRYGLSLRKAWLCPKCGSKTHKPLSAKTGWCVSCTREARNESLAREVDELRKEAMREKKVNRERQRLYSAKSRAKKSRKK